MSSSPVSQLLQITAPRADTKPQPPNSSHNRPFQDLLARASSSTEGKSKQDTTTSPDEPLTDNLEQDTSSQYEEAATTSDSPSDATSETLEVQEDDESDVIELSETAELVLGTQGVPEEILSAEVTTEPAVEASVSDAPSIENYANQSKSESQESAEQFAKTIEVIRPVNQHDQFMAEQAGAKEQAALVESIEEAASQSQESPELPASAQIVDSGEQLVQTIAVEDDSKPATTHTASTTQASPAKAEGSVAIATETPEESTDRMTSSHEPKVDRDGESAPVKPDTIVETEESVNAGKETSSVQSSPSSSAVVNPAGDEAVAAVLRSPASQTGEGSPASNLDADLELVPTIDRTRFVQRVGRAFQTAQAREGQIQLRLSPPELGSLRISINVHEGVVSAKVEAETAAARNILLDNLPALRERLAEQEIRIEKFDVDVRRDGGQETSNSGTNDHQSRQTQADSAPFSREREHGHLETTSSARLVNPVTMISDDGLDVRI